MAMAQQNATAPIPLPIIDWDKENKQEAFQEWKEFLESYFIINRVDERQKWNYILLSTGSRGRELLITSGISEDEKLNSENVWRVFENHMVEKPNKWVERIEFQSLTQNADESFENFALRIRNKANKCGFNTEETKNERITEQLIKGIKWPEERRHLISMGNNLTLENTLAYAKSHEAAIKNSENYNAASSTTATRNINAVRKQNYKKSTKKKCSRCGLHHETHKNKCPAMHDVCRKCKCRGHWESQCFSKLKQQRHEHRSTSRYRSSREDRSQQRHRPKMLAPNVRII